MESSDPSSKAGNASRRPVDRLPVDQLIPELLTVLKSGQAVVLRAPTGSGKTTRVPPAVAHWLAKGPVSAQGQVLVVEPRRLSARAAAARVAFESGEAVGDFVGYRIRFENRSSARTRLLFVTEGVLLARLRSDPFLEGVAAVVFDEVHERSLDLDLALSMAQRLRSTVREDLRIVVMSATLDPQPLLEYLSPAQALTSEGRLHPVQVEYLARPDDRRLEVKAVDAVVGVLETGAGKNNAGDILVFLPGVGEIRRSLELAEERGVARVAELLSLYGDMAIEKQHAVLTRPPGGASRRRVIFATNVAESSVTVQGVTTVIDSGLERRLRFDAGASLDRLELVTISRASAEQRKGRAGRERAGSCLRLWTRSEETQRRDRTPPDVARVDLSSSVLQLVAWGEGDVLGFPWLERPDAARLEVALQLLVSLRAIEETTDTGRRLFRITDTGSRMVSLGMHPRLARLMLEGAARGLVDETAAMVALLEERDIFERSRGSQHQDDTPRLVPSVCDLQDRLDALAGIQDPSGRRVVRSRARQVERSASQLRRRMLEELEPAGRRSSNQPLSHSHRRVELRKLILAAFPDRVSRLREVAPKETAGGRAVLYGGRGVQLSSASAVNDVELFVAVDVRMGARGEARVELATAIEESWLEPERITEEDVPDWDPDAGRVRCSVVTRYGDLVLSRRERAIDSTLEPSVRAACSSILLAAAKDRLGEVMPLSDRRFSEFLARVRSVAAWRPELGLPDVSDRGLGQQMTSYAGDAVSLAELAKKPWFDILRGSLGFDLLREIDRLAPERLKLANGRSLRVRYSHEGSDPIVAARIQDFFGCAETPTVDGGRRTVLLHLLAPNGRPQQVTRDLASFWQNTYAQVRAELAGRYPKHAWPKKP